MDRAVLLKRSFSTVLLWLTVLGMIFSGWKTGCVVLLGVAALLAQWEFYRIQEEKKFRVFKKWGVACGAILYVGCWYLLLHASAYAGRFALWEHLVFVALTIGVLLRLVVFPDPLETPILSVALTLFGFFYVPYLFSFVAQVAFLPGAPYEATFTILYLLAVTKFCDAGAYVVGSLWGRHKMIPRISPGKTWEGFAGGILTSMAVSILLWRIHPQGLPPFGWGDALVCGFLLALASVVGDLAESVVKRDAHVKDSGHAFPGIGGVLDLIDSLLFTAPVFYFYVALVVRWR